ncbi:hypothetical protein OAJ65_01850 [Flavobacteriales bacterium]|nr:hypothetical protein [Flavobacteriales bacterium]
MKKLLLILLCLPMIGVGQFTDNFSDGDFTNNPNWMGNVGSFEVDTNYKLHLNDSIANISSLVTQSQAIINGEWIFDVKLDFSPSTSNYARVYLVSDMIDLSGGLNGMYVKIGGQTGSIDDISLYTQSGTNHNEIIDGVDGLVTNNPDISVKVTRDAIGNWELFLDTNGVFFTQGTAFDNSMTSSDYFGIYCKYTITRSDKFWFDNFSVSGGAISQPKTYVPDDNFEQWLIVLGHDNVLDDSVITANINSVTSLNLWNQNISDLTGIEDFTALVSLDCVDNLLTHLDVSQNTALDTLFCGFNQLTTLDISGANTLRFLGCGINQIITLDVSNNTLLTHLVCDDNLITNLDISNNHSLNFLDCSFNQLTSLDVSNNTSLTSLYCSNNPNLYCINVDDTNWAITNWTVANGNIDPQHYFSNNCSGTTNIQEENTKKEILKVTDLLGRETKNTNQPLFYIYDDRMVEKKIIIE